MYRLAGTKEENFTPGEIEREARDSGNLLALAALRLLEDMVTEEDHEYQKEAAVQEAKDEATEVLVEVQDALVEFLADGDEEILEDLLFTVKQNLVEKP